MKLQKSSVKVAAAVSVVLTSISIELARANVVGSEAQNFNPTTSGLDFVTVQSSETLKPGIINVGLFLNYAVNTLPYFGDSPQNRLNFSDSLLGLDLNAGLGLTDNWDIGFSLPQILRQAVDDGSGPRGEFAQTGATELRMNTKYRFWGDDSGGFALVASTNLNRIEDNPYAGRGAGPTYNLEVAADTTIGKLAIGGNLGYRMRNPGTPIPNSLAQPLGDQWIASTAASYHVTDWNTKVIGELYGSLPTNLSASESSSYGERSLTSLELLVGAKHDLTTNLAFHAGAGTELLQGVASPDWRIYSGINYAFGPAFSPSEIASVVRGRSLEPDRHLVAVPTDSPAEAERFRTQSIHFEFDSDRMQGTYMVVLAELASHLNSGYQELVIEGHTDSIGPEVYNEKLSLRRASAIKRYLVEKHQVDARKISTVGYGESRPIADNGNYQGRYRNRRVEFLIKR
jgi:outer membrane protein OmpA-like peptidoglycan-associated protein